MRVVRQQLHGSHKRSKLFVLYVFLACVVSFQITKLNTVNKLSWVSSFTTKYFYKKIKKILQLISRSTVVSIPGPCPASSHLQTNNQAKKKGQPVVFIPMSMRNGKNLQNILRLCVVSLAPKQLSICALQLIAL